MKILSLYVLTGILSLCSKTSLAVETGISVGDRMECVPKVIIQENGRRRIIDHVGGEGRDEMKSGIFGPGCDSTGGQNGSSCKKPLRVAPHAVLATSSEKYAYLAFYYALTAGPFVPETELPRTVSNDIKGYVGIISGTWTHNFFTATYQSSVGNRIIKLNSRPTSGDGSRGSDDIGYIGKIGPRFTFQFPANDNLLRLYPNAVGARSYCRIVRN